MSAGAFQLAKYESNSGSVYPVRVQPETLALTIDGNANAEPAGAVTIDQLVKVSRSRGEYGVLPRKVSIRFTGTAPTGYKADQTYTIPVLTEAVWDAATRTTAANYLGVAAEVVSRSSESIR